MPWFGGLMKTAALISSAVLGDGGATDFGRQHRALMVVAFAVAFPGRYTLTFATDAGVVMIQHSFGERFRRNVPWTLTHRVGGGLRGQPR